MLGGWFESLSWSDKLHWCWNLCSSFTLLKKSQTLVILRPPHQLDQFFPLKSQLPYLPSGWPGASIKGQSCPRVVSAMRTALPWLPHGTNGPSGAVVIGMSRAQELMNEKDCHIPCKWLNYSGLWALAWRLKELPILFKGCSGCPFVCALKCITFLISGLLLNGHRAASAVTGPQEKTGPPTQRTPFALILATHSVVVVVVGRLFLPWHEESRLSVL